MRGIVIDLFGMQGTDNADIVRDAADVRKQRGDLLPGLAPFPEFTKRSARDQLGVLQLGQLLALSKRVRERLPVKLFEPGLEIKTLQMLRTPCHAQVNDPPGFHRKVRRIDGSLPTLRGGGGLRRV